MVWNEQARTELNSIKSDLRNILTELRSISQGVRTDFSGIGNDRCADVLDNVISQYEYVQRKLNNIDTKTIKEGFGK